MTTIEQRVAFLEGQVGEHSQRMTGILDALTGLDRRMAAFEECVDRRFEAIDGRFESLESRLSRQFMWLVGIQVSTLLAVVAALTVR